MCPSLIAGSALPSWPGAYNGLFHVALLRTLTPVDGVCRTSSGPNSPNLLAAGVRYKFIDGDHISYCPDRNSYNANDLMVLRFAPLAGGAIEFHLVEGEGGENQLIDPTSSRGARYWNFLRIRLN